MGKLLFDESPLVVQPTLAKAIGLNEAIVLQQINYWLNQKGIGKTIHGEKWIYNTVADWQENFPFWSQETIKRTIYNLQDAQLIKSGTYNQSPTDRTKWYTINFAVVDLLEALIQQEKDLAAEAVNDATCQNDTMDVSDCYDIPETTSETTKTSPAASMENSPNYINPFKTWESVGLQLSPYIAERLKEFETVYTALWVDEAIRRAARTNKRNLAYIEGILKRWAAAGVMDAPALVVAPAVLTEQPDYQRNIKWAT